MLGLLGLRIFEATGSDIGELGEEHGHRVLRCATKGQRRARPAPARGEPRHRALDDRTIGPILLTRRGTRMDPHGAALRYPTAALTSWTF
jgi:integrase/recombinase XerD